MKTLFGTMRRNMHVGLTDLMARRRQYLEKELISKKSQVDGALTWAREAILRMCTLIATVNDRKVHNDKEAAEYDELLAEYRLFREELRFLAAELENSRASLIRDIEDATFTLSVVISSRIKLGLSVTKDLLTYVQQVRDTYNALSRSLEVSINDQA